MFFPAITHNLPAIISLKLQLNSQEVQVSVEIEAKSSNHKTRSQVTLTITVTDTGKGIPADQLDKVFGAFEQVSGQKSSQYRGTGLGLSISKRIVELMGATITLTSEVGRRSQFTIEIPHVEVAALADLQSAQESLEPDRIAFEPAFILIVDDVPYNRDLIQTFLQNWPFEFVQAGTGKEALEQMEQRVPDLVITDIKMPEMSGVELMKIMQQDERFKTIPVVVVTASVLGKDKKEVESLCNIFLAKPVSLSDLLMALMKYLPHTIKEVEPQVVDPTKLDDAEDHSEPKTPTEPEPSAKSEVNGTNKVLLVDDSDINLMIMQVELEEIGMKADTALSGAEALEMMEQNLYSLVITDVEMPDMDGYELSEQLRAKYTERVAGLKILGFTADKEGKLKEGLKSGMDDVLNKPLIKQEVTDILMPILGKIL